MTAYAKTSDVILRIYRQTGRMLTPDAADTLRRAALTLHRWAEGTCGDSNDYASWCLVRDDDGTTWREVYPHTASKSRRERVPDRETGALRRVQSICQANGLHYYHQGDPRGCALYVAAEPLTDTDYTRGVAVA